MGFTRKDWLEAKREGAVKRHRKLAPQYHAAAQAEVPAKLLTQHAAWNWFLQVIAKRRELAAEALEQLEVNSRSMNDFSHEALARLQATRRSMAMRVETYEEVMGIPSEVVDGAKDAKQKLSELNRAESNEKSDRPAAS